MNNPEETPNIENFLRARIAHLEWDNKRLIEANAKLGAQLQPLIDERNALLDGREAAQEEVRREREALEERIEQLRVSLRAELRSRHLFLGSLGPSVSAVEE